MCIKALYPCKDERALLPWEIEERVEQALASPSFTGGVVDGVRDKPCSQLFLDDLRRLCV